MVRCGVLLMLGLAVVGCRPPKDPDSHPEVFQSVEEARANRRAAQVVQWRQTALSILRVDRPDLTGAKTDEFAITISADGQSMKVDLSPMEPALMADSTKDRQLLRPFLVKQVALFSQQRLAAMGFENARPLLEARLLKTRQLIELGEQIEQVKVLDHQAVVVDVSWLPVARWPQTQEWSVIGDRVIEAWKIDRPALQRASLDNLGKRLTNEALETVSFGPMGSAGHVKNEIGAGVLVLPEFLAMVRKNWKINDDLVLFLGGPNDLGYVPRSNGRLLDLMYRTWQTRQEREDLLSKNLLLLSDGGVMQFAYRPSTAPATTSKPATKPKPYIVLP